MLKGQVGKDKVIWVQSDNLELDTESSFTLPVIFDIILRSCFIQKSSESLSGTTSFIIEL